jgi:NCS1 family nucleobase:cation symporter-1
MKDEMHLSGDRLKATVQNKMQKARQTFSSWKSFQDRIQVGNTVLDEYGQKTTGPVWSNEDLDPTPPEKRTWRWWNFVVFYCGLSFGNWTLGATMIGIGLNWYESEGGKAYGASEYVFRTVLDPWPLQDCPRHS